MSPVHRLQTISTDHGMESGNHSCRSPLLTIHNHWRLTILKISTLRWLHQLWVGSEDMFQFTTSSGETFIENAYDGKICSSYSACIGRKCWRMFNHFKVLTRRSILGMINDDLADYTLPLSTTTTSGSFEDDLQTIIIYSYTYDSWHTQLKKT